MSTKIKTLSDIPLSGRTRPIRWIETATGCYESTSHQGCADGGYPYIKVKGVRYIMSRFIISQLHLGGEKLPSGIVVRHKCDNPRCINPGHLMVGTHADNVADRVARGRSCAGEKNGRAKLTEDQVREIRKADSNCTFTDLAALYKVSRYTISAIRKGKKWKCVV